eukprot:GGOE01060989.1.p1 GENE.GGOE01060989.1~~GGOE01060989.1.p1  ORF type:complete len:155 (+),score=34.40 GGOE01060989.1:58-522(+)
MHPFLHCAVWLALLGLQGAQVVLLTFYIAMFIDYEEDTGPSSVELTKRLKTLFHMEYLGHAVNCVLLLCGYHLELFLVNAPILLFHLHQFYTNQYIIDPDMLWKTVAGLKNRTFAKLAVQMVLMVIYVILAMMHFADTWSHHIRSAPTAANVTA